MMMVKLKALALFLLVFCVCGCMPSFNQSKYVADVSSLSKKSKPPKLLSHDLGGDNEPAVFINRIFFSFLFDQKIDLDSANSIYIRSKNKDISMPKIKRITMDDNHQRIIVELDRDEASAFLEGKKYYFEFGAGIKNLQGDKTEEAPIEFIANGIAEPLAPRREVEKSVLHNGAEISILLNNAHVSKFRFGHALENLNCLGSLCPKLRSIPSKNKKTSTLNYLSRFFIAGLASNSRYFFSLESVDMQGSALKRQGEFSTTASGFIRFSEIMISPKTSAGLRENNGEFIELKNISSKPFYLSGLSLSLESFDSSRLSRCEIKFDHSEPLVPGGGHALIVSSQFLAEKYRVDPAASLIYLDSKSLCGGLTNSTAKILKIFGPSGRLLDRYGGFLWSNVKGRSISRIDVTGLDEANNYCYSNPEVGPTPGLANEA